MGVGNLKRHVTLWAGQGPVAGLIWISELAKSWIFLGFLPKKAHLLCCAVLASFVGMRIP